MWTNQQHLTSPSVSPLLAVELEQIDFIDSCPGEEEEEERKSRGGDGTSLSSQFMAYIERRITREVGDHTLE